VAAVPVFADLPERELDAIAAAATEVERGPGEALTTEGEFGHCVFAIESGAAEISVDGSRVGEVGPGDVLGEIAVLASGRRTASVVATSPLRALSLFKRDVWALEREAPEAARRLRAALEQHRGSTR
jgi:CPA1 family monovalent cation:H+ antiporter